MMGNYPAAYQASAGALDVDRAFYTRAAHGARECHGMRLPQ